VKRLRCILVLFLTAAAVWVSAVPRIDLPETAFNETDAPVNLTPPVRPGIQLTAPAINPIVVSAVPALAGAAYVIIGAPSPSVPLPAQRHRISLQYLLCTFLI
jgi:hypothetical protein